MKKNLYSSKRSSILISISIFFILSSVISCGLIQRDFKTFNSKEYDKGLYVKNSILGSLPLFTFEYPRSFRTTHTSELPTISENVARLSFVKWREGSQGLFWGSYIIILVARQGGDLIDLTPDILFNGKIAHYQSDNNFKILEKEEKTVSGYNAKYVSFICYNEGDKGDKSGNDPRSDRIERYACFGLNGYLWEIEMQTYRDDDKEMAPNYEHLINTFKIAGD
jgi:hypothetical protein